jgi:hypothetical protein
MARTSKTSSGGRSGRGKTYDAFAAASDYSPGDVLHFDQVRHWLGKGELVEAYGRVLSVERFDNEVPYITVSFSDPEVKELNSIDLGNWPRNFLVELKA